MIPNRFTPHAATRISLRAHNGLSNRNTSHQDNYVVTNYVSLLSSNVICSFAPPAQQLTYLHTSSATLSSASAIQKPDAKHTPPQSKNPATHTAAAGRLRCGWRRPARPAGVALAVRRTTCTAPRRGAHFYILLGPDRPSKAVLP